MSGRKAKPTISELVLSAVFHLQQMNGVSVMEIADYVAEKTCGNPSKLRRPVKQILNRAKEHGIMSECRGEFKIEGRYDDKMKDKGSELQLSYGYGGCGAGDSGETNRFDKVEKAPGGPEECRKAYSWPDEDVSEPSFKRRRTYRDVVTCENNKFCGRVHRTSIGKRL